MDANLVPRPLRSLSRCRNRHRDKQGRVFVSHLIIGGPVVHLCVLARFSRREHSSLRFE
jgi:hypothetical protein